MKTRLRKAFAAIIVLLMPAVNFGQAPPLGTAAPFALFTTTGAFGVTGAATTVTGDVGTNAGAFTAFPPGTLNGTKHVIDPVSVTAAADVQTAYGSMSTITCGSVIGVTMGGGQILLPDVYCTGAASTINGDLTLDGGGDPNALFIFKIGGALATTVNSHILLTGSASLCNVYWQVNGEVDLGENSLFQGTILANGAINLLDGATLLGRGLSQAGAISLQTNVVTLSPQQVASTISADGATTFCEGGSVTLSGNVGGIWSNGATTASIIVSTSGDYFVTNTNNCASAISNHIVVTVNPLPVCTITGNGSVCEGQTTQLCAPDGYASYSWSTGATSRCINVTTAGTYSVTVTSASGCQSTCSKTLLLNQLPIAAVVTASGPTTFCTGGSVILSGNVGGTWSTRAKTASITVTTSGDYFLTNTNACGSVTSNHIVVTVNPIPNCTITGNGSICEGQTAHLCAPAGYASYSWSTGETTACIDVTKTGTYSVTVTNASGCSSTCSKDVTVNQLPTASVITAGGPISFCTGGNVILSGNIGGVWSTGATTASITVTKSGNYSVTNKNACGSVTSNIIVVTVLPLPNCTITGNCTICLGQTIQLCAPAGYAQYLWSTGATTTCINVTKAGTYSVTVTNASGCSSTCSKTVTVNTLPIASVIKACGPTTFCQGKSVVLSGNIGGVWSNGATTPTITVTTSGDYFVTNKNACNSVTSNHIIVTVNPLPDCTITGNGLICLGQTTQLCAPGGYAKYLWSTGATTSCITVTKAGTYSVTVTNASGCSSTCCKTVNVSTLPIASKISACGPTTFCQGGSVKLSGNYCGVWSNGATTPSITVTTGGDYYVTNKNDCNSVTSNHILVTVNPLPTATTGPNVSICCGESATLGALPIAGNTYCWKPATGLSSATIANPVAKPAVTTTYYLTETITATGCQKTNCVTVKVNAAPKITTQPANTTACVGGTARFLVCATGDGLKYQWRKGTINVTNGGNISGATTSTLKIYPVKSTDAASNYNVVVTGTCSPVITSSNVSLTLSKAEAIASSDVGNTNEVVTIYPNPFSTSMNVVLNDESQINKYDLLMYNAWGAEVMNTALMTKSTTFMTVNLPAGIYFYKVIDHDRTIQSGKLISQW
jgi:hypothetical protein